jgi:integrase
MTRSVVGTWRATWHDWPSCPRLRPTRRAAEPHTRRMPELLQATKADRVAALWTLALATGAAVGSCSACPWGQVDLNVGTLRIDRALRRACQAMRSGRRKTSSSVRTTRLGPSSISTLRRHRTAQLQERLAAGERWQDSGLVFSTAIGTPLDPRNVTRSWHELTARAGLEGGKITLISATQFVPGGRFAPKRLIRGLVATRAT